MAEQQSMSCLNLTFKHQTTLLKNFIYLELDDLTSLLRLLEGVCVVNRKEDRIYGNFLSLSRHIMMSWNVGLTITIWWCMSPYEGSMSTKIP